jgi:hypothetical protein
MSHRSRSHNVTRVASLYIGLISLALFHRAFEFSTSHNRSSRPLVQQLLQQLLLRRI